MLMSIILNYSIFVLYVKSNKVSVLSEIQKVKNSRVTFPGKALQRGVLLSEGLW